MAHNEPGSDNFPANIQVPDDGDNATAASLSTGLIALADRTTHHEADLAFLAQLGARAPDDGIKHVRAVATLAALKAIAGGAGIDGEFAWVDASRGLYRYFSAAVNAPDEPWVVQPTTGGGRWFRAQQGDLNGPDGLLRLDSSGYVPQTAMHRPILEVDSAEQGIADEGNAEIGADHTTTAFADVGPTLTLNNLNNGDEIIAEAVCHARQSATDSVVRLVVVDGASTVALEVVTFSDAGIRPYRFTPPKYLKLNNGTSSVTLKFQRKIKNGAGAVEVFEPAAIRAQVLRP